MAEIFLSAFVQVVFQKLTSQELINFVRREGVHTTMKKWTSMLMKILAVLSDAEEKQITNPTVKIWLDELRDLAYDVEDVLDEFATEALRRKVMAEPQASSTKLRSLIPTCCKPSAIVFNFRMESKINTITSRLQDISKQKAELNLIENCGGMSNRIRDRSVSQTSSVAESHVYGRGEDKEAIVKLLFSGEVCNEVCVIPIIGMGGVGKTTLANIVYNDNRVKDYFDLQSWVCVSDEFDLIRVTKAILQSLDLKTIDFEELSSLQESLKEKLSKQKFLLILDDVWHENYDDWTKLRRPLEVGAPGSKIIVTARNQGVADIMGTISAYRLEELSNDVCLSVFTQHALGTTDFSAHPNLKHTGEEIVKRCKGLPLAAKVLGGLLRTTRNLDKWEDALHSQIWDLPEERSTIMPALRLSYHHLSPSLKQCFAYCSILPKDYEFEKEELVLLWMAEGLLQQPSDNKQMEDIGDEYFHDLLSRSFFQLSSINESKFIMHDLINDLAQWVAGKTCFRLEDKLEPCKISKKVRHSSYVRREFDGYKKFEAFDEAEGLRTFLPLMTAKTSYLTSKVPLNLLPKLKSLRVLSLSGYSITELPDLFGDLKHLRFLDMSRTKIRSLPESTSTLYNLQTLILKDCSCLKKLPASMGNLINLRHLDITNCDLMKEMPLRVGQLTCLQKLSNFIVGNGSGSQIRDLINLKYLRTLCISRLENVIDARGASFANLKDKQYLNVLRLGWSSEFNDSRNEGLEKDVLDGLQPHKRLKELTIKCYGGSTLSTWLGDPSFSKMVLLKLENCVNCTSLPSLGQLPLLKSLCIKGMNGVKIVGLEFSGRGCPSPFPSLEILSFEDMPEWERWFPSRLDGQVEVFSRLREMSLKRCPKLLEELPNYLPSLEKLVIDECPQVAVSISSLPEHCELEIWEDYQEVVKGSISALKSLILCNISKVPHLTQGFVRGLRSVEDLKIVSSDEVTYLWQQEVGLLHHLTSLRRLKIKGCPKFVSLVAEEAEQQQGLPCRLESLEFYGCNNLEKLQGFHNLTSLRELTIKDCDSVTSIARDQLPSTLKKLEIRNCKNLLCIELEGEGSTFSSCSSLLESLDINGCYSLMSLSSKGELPATLKYLCIWYCPKLESVAERLYNNTSLETIEIWNCESLKSLPEALHSLIHLSRIEIVDCPSLVHLFPDGVLPATNLTELWIYSCEKLESLPDHMHNLTSLQELGIVGCGGIVTFPEEGFPTNLTSLWIKDLNICEPLFEWGLHRLTSLTRIEIKGGCPDLVSFPKEDKGMMLPTSLAQLSISDFPNLEHLSFEGLQNLTSLKYLGIFMCPKLKSLLEEGMPPSLSMGFQNLTSLERLEISSCPKLKSFPEEGLPPSLLHLYVYNCPLLKQRCKKDQGGDWPKITHIPCVYIDGKYIYDPEDMEE
ncbi:hypothetical protein L1049_011332 [Liquidambar formosana]|uniref:Disease resistance RPP13-like protein 1 n=1 Tax=Liquidambar formosana TaxID=63359 RepID=A0AAP0RRE5_LIQFO